MPPPTAHPFPSAAWVAALLLAGAGTLHAQTTAAPATGGASAASNAGAAGAAGGLYKVTDGYKVDSATMDGFRAWRSAACDRCHGPNQEGMVGPSLLATMKTLSKEDFKNVVLNGRLEKGMPSFNTNQSVTAHIDGLYAYLKGRSDGAITRAKVEEMK